MAKQLYLLLTRSNTLVSRAIYQVTKDEFTHISISLEEDLSTMYSFCRRYARSPLPAGFTSETLYHGFYKQHQMIPCRLYALTISDTDYTRLRIVLDMLMEKSKQLKYDILGTMFCRMDIQHQRPNHRYCSWFVAELLGQLQILSFSKDYSLVRPIDFTFFEEMELIFTGTVGQLASQLVLQKNN